MNANEWHEIQNKRVTSVPLTLFWIGFFMLGVGLQQNLAQSAPIAHAPADTCTHSGTNQILRFAVTTFFWLLISLIQALYVYIIHHRYISDPLGSFVDLLSVSNISLFILCDRIRGYYVHGRSVHPHADTHMSELNENLQKEEDNLCATRGLLPNSTQQVFEITVTPKLRDQFESIYLALIADNVLHHPAHAANRPPGSAPQQLAPHPNIGRAPLPTEKLVTANAAVNKFLSMFIDHGLQDHPYLIMEKTTWQRIFDVPPDTALTAQSILSPARLNAFGNVLFLGCEYDLLLFDILVYSLVDLAQNTTISILVTFLVGKIVSIVRSWWGKKNLSRKTLVDSRFLI